MPRPGSGSGSLVRQLARREIDLPARDRAEQPRTIVVDRAHDGVLADRGELETRRVLALERLPADTTSLRE